jgi:hypothetical protein
MTDFVFTSPQGKTYTVTGPEGSTKEEAYFRLQRQLAGMPPPPPMSAGDQAADIAKSGGIGLARGTIGLAGAPADTRALNKTLGGMIGTKLGLSPETQSKIGSAYDLASRIGLLGPLESIGNVIPTSRAIQSRVEDVTGQFYGPKTRAGRYTETVSSFLPSAVAGPGGLSRRVGAAVASGLASEAAGEATAGTKYEPYARTGAALVGGFPFGRWRSAPQRGASAAPLAEDLYDAGKTAYRQIKDMDVRLATQPVAKLARSIEARLTDDGLTKTNVPETYAVIDRLKQLARAPAGAFVRASDFDAARQEFLQATRNISNQREKVSGWRAIEDLDRYLSSIPAADVIKGDAGAASKLFSEARGNWAAAKRVEMLGAKLGLGDLNAATAHSGMNRDNAIRQAVKQLIRPDKYGKTLAQKHGFNAREIAAMNDIARGTATINTLRYIGNLLGGGGGLGALAAGAAGAGLGYETDHPELMGLGLLGYGARRTAGAMTERQGQRLFEDVSRRSPAGGGVLPRRPSEADRLIAAGLLRAHQADREREPPRPQYGGPM